jgi:hypothetical protein
MWARVDSEAVRFTRHKPSLIKSGASSAGEGERLRARLSAFGEDATENPVKAQIAELRNLRNAGRVNPNEYAERVSLLLGSSEGTTTRSDPGSDARAADADDTEPLYL